MSFEGKEKKSAVGWIVGASGVKTENQGAGSEQHLLQVFESVLPIAARTTPPRFSGFTTVII